MSKSNVFVGINGQGVYRGAVMKIRREKLSDVMKTRVLYVQAFPTEAEADLLGALRSSGTKFISLVAEEGEEINGHIFFTPVRLTAGSAGLKMMGLAPMAVAPRIQNQGIGSRLVKAGLKLCRDEEYDAVAVLGHPEYYPRFGFLPSVQFDIKSEYDVPDEVFMILELSRGALRGKKGTVMYHGEFGNL